MERGGLFKLSPFASADDFLKAMDFEEQVPRVRLDLITAQPWSAS